MNRLSLKAYDSNNLVNLSDHRPVFAQFLLQIDLESHESEAEEENQGPLEDDGRSGISKVSSLSRTSRHRTKNMTESQVLHHID